MDGLTTDLRNPAAPTDQEVRARMVLRLACATVGVDAARATVIRLGENALFRLGDGLVARVARPGHRAVAAKEVAVSRWLAALGVPVVRTAPGILQPVEVGDRVVTFWVELPPHRAGTVTEIASAVRRVHDLAAPAAFTLGPLEPFARLSQRIWRASTVGEADRRWLRRQLAWLRGRWRPQRRPQQPSRTALPEHTVLHGDAWAGNVLCTEDGTVVLADLERFAVGPPEWDLAHTAVKYSSLGWIDAAEYAQFCARYGADVTGSPDFALYRDIREFRMTCSALQRAAEDPRYVTEAAHRLACLRGDHGPRPWPGWRPMV